MARLGRLFVPGFPQLVLLRGNNGAQIFIEEADYRLYLEILREVCRELAVALHAYVLMPDHLHLFATAHEAEHLSALMQRIGRRYVRGFNDRHKRSGTLWEGRYRSTAVEPQAYALACYRYLELNPLRRGLASEALAYPWSSCRHHLGLVSDPFINDHSNYWALGNTPFERQAHYRALLEAGSPHPELEAIRYAGYRGWMLGEPPRHAEGELGRRVAPLPKGRPKKTV